MKQSHRDKIDLNELKQKRVGVLMGGFSAEREVSLKSGQAILKALLDLGYDAIAIDVDQDVVKKMKEENIEVAFIALHGRYGEDGVIQGVLEMFQIPYTGSGVMASALGMDKVFSRRIFKNAGLPILPYTVVPRGATASSIALPLPLPVVVKPTREGSSIGVSIVKSEDELAPALEEAWRYDDAAIVEEYLKGREIQIGVLDEKAIGSVEIVPNREFYDYEAKYTEGGAEHLVPAPVTREQVEEVNRLAVDAHRALDCEGATRVDFLFEESRGFFLLEVNTLPGMTELSLLPEIAADNGMDFPKLVERILAGARIRA